MVMETEIIQRNQTYILIPAYKPDHLMIELLKKLRAEGFEIIVVNDGSGKDFDDIFNEASQYATILIQNRNRGKGAALRLGFSYINLHQENHRFVITCDADGQHAVEDIIRLNDKMIETDTVVFGVRKFDKSVPKRSRNGNFMSRLCRTLITKEYVQDDQCGLRGIPVRYAFDLMSLPGDHYEYEMNAVCVVQMKRLKIEEIPIETIYLNNNASSHFRPNLDTFRIQKTIWMNSLVPLISALLSVALLFMLTTLLPSWPVYVHFLFSYIFFFELYIGVVSLIYPTKKMGRRVLIEGVYASIKTTIVFGFFIIFYTLCHFHPVIAYTLSLLIAFISNYPLAYLAWKIKKGKI